MQQNGDGQNAAFARIFVYGDGVSEERHGHHRNEASEQYDVVRRQERRGHVISLEAACRVSEEQRILVMVRRRERESGEDNEKIAAILAGVGSGVRVEMKCLDIFYGLVFVPRSGSGVGLDRVRAPNPIFWAPKPKYLLPERT